MHPLTPDDPRTVGPHRLLARLGAGGMGRVYLARTPGGDLAAVKLVKDDLAHDPEFRARFAREVRAARRVRGPFTPAVADADTDAGVPWMATEYVPGPTLKEAVRGHGPLPAESLPVLVSGLARALEAVHAADLMHRDLKPGNVLLSPRGPQVIDFGLARAVEGTVLTRTGQTFGTPAYASPEQITGRETAPASDVFSLAGTVLFAASGEPPFGPARGAATLNRILSGEPNLAAVPEGPLRDLLARCLDKDPAGRPDVTAILTALADVPMPRDTHEWLPAPVTEDVRLLQGQQAGEPAGRGRWRRPALVAGAAAAALALVAGGGYALTALPGDGASGTAGERAAAGEGSGAAEGGGEAPEGGIPNGAFASTEVDPDLRAADEITFSPDGERMYATGVGSFSVWDWRAGETVGHLDPTPLGTDVAPGGLLAAAHEDRIEILGDDGATFITTLVSDDPEVTRYHIPALSPDGGTAAALTTRNDDYEDGNAVTVWDVGTGEVVLDIDLAGSLRRMEYTADGRYLVGEAVTRMDEAVLGVGVWDTDTGEWVHYFESPGGMTFGLDPADPSVMALLDDGRVRLVDLETGGTVREMAAPAPGHRPVESLVFSPDGTRLYGGAGFAVEPEQAYGSVWDTATGEAVRNGDVLLPAPLGVHPGGEVVAAYDDAAGAVLILDGDDLTIIREMS
ncbi:WD40 repeat domain-containing serine/threonine protein kinase [Nocardiopsis sp. CC223A]|uniref:WD40 repeat domain-containing serine/threonine protein kinase n=1 Tax=Nocardiopsis sp. CC223A TaxID=3044051 RepID=UPI002795C3C7|nr:serine/threonine-protein kinase [Nocardiopsis sp. CC223A]